MNARRPRTRPSLLVGTVIMGVLGLSLPSLLGLEGAHAQGPRAGLAPAQRLGPGGPAGLRGARGAAEEVEQDRLDGVESTLAGAQLALRRGQWLVGGRHARRLLEDDPDNDDLFAILAIASSRANVYPDAVAAFEFVGGASMYDRAGLGAHADALRYTGDAAGAAELRTQQLLQPDVEPSQQLVLILGIVDDLRAAGDLQGAYEEAWRALSFRPRSPSAHAFLAEVLLDLGDLDGALFHLWMARDIGTDTLRVPLVEARIALAEGNVQAARRATDEALEIRRNSARVGALHATVLRLEGSPDDALQVLERNVFKLQDHPDLVAAMILVLRDLGRLDEARAEAERGRVTYPGHDGVREAAALLGVD